MGRRAGLTPELVQSAALALADESGLESVTLAAVADRLGVRSPSLYAHVEGIPGLRRALTIQAVAALAHDLREARRARHGRSALRALAMAYRAFARVHPGWYAAAQQAVPPGKDDALYRAHAEAVMPLMETLAELGVPPGEMLHQIRVVRSALHGFVSLEHGNSFGLAVDFDDSYAFLVDQLCRAIGAPAPAPTRA